MQHQEPPRRSSDGHSDLGNNIPEGICPATYNITVAVSADFLKSIEGLAYALGFNKHQMDTEIFTKGIENIAVELMQSQDEKLAKNLENVAPLGTLVRKNRPLW